VSAAIAQTTVSPQPTRWARSCFATTASVGNFTSGTANTFAKVLVYQHTVASGDSSVTATFSAKFAKSVALSTYRSVTLRRRST